MKKVFIVFTIAACFVLCADISAANLLKNDSFELQKEQQFDLPENWEILNPRPRTVTAKIDNEDVLAGKNSVRIVNKDPENKKIRITWMQKNLKEKLNKLAPYGEMEFSIYAKTIGKLARLHIFFESPSAKKCVPRVFELSPGRWRKLTVKFPLEAADYSSAYVCAQLIGCGEVLFDCAYLGKVGENPYENLSKSPAELAANDHCRMMDQPVSSRFDSGKSPKEAVLSMFLPTADLQVTLAEIDGKTVKKWSFSSLPVRKMHTLKLELPQLPDGAYEMKYNSGNLNDFDCFRVGNVPERGAWFNENGYPVIDGKTVFPVGILSPSDDPDCLRVYQASGMNMITPQVPLFDDYYDYMSELAEKFDFYWFSWNSWGFQRYSNEALKATLLARRNIIRKHGRFMGFYSDEAMWQNIPLSSMRQHYKFMMKYLPEYISWLNHAPRLTGSPGEARHSFDSGRRYTRAADLASVDIYPVPETHGHNNLPNRTLACVGEYTDICRSMTWNTRPVWMILQAMSWSELNSGKITAKYPRPDKRQLRFMAWNAISHGAKGIFWYGRGCRDVYSKWWVSLAEVSCEIAAVGKMMTTGKVTCLKDLPEGVSGISGKGFKVYVNENKSKPAVVGNITIPPQDVRIITDKPLDLPVIKQFSPEKVKLSKDYGFSSVVILDAHWVCHPEYRSGSGRTYYARQDFDLPSLPSSGTLRISVDDMAKITINGQKIGTNANQHRIIQQFDIGKFLKAGKNTIEFEIFNATGPTGLVFEISDNGKKLISSGKDTMFSLDGKDFSAPRLISKHPAGTWGKPVIVQKMK